MRAIRPQATGDRVARLGRRDTPLSRASTTRLVARRATSHSNGPGSVSSKSRRSNDKFRSGVAQRPKLRTCASPHICTMSSVCGRVARSAAMTAAAPRKKVHGDTIMRPNRIGTRSATRTSFCASRVSTTPRTRSEESTVARLRRGERSRAFAARCSPCRLCGLHARVRGATHCAAFRYCAVSSPVRSSTVISMPNLLPTAPIASSTASRSALTGTVN